VCERSEDLPRQDEKVLFLPNRVDGNGVFIFFPSCVMVNIQMEVFLSPDLLDQGEYMIWPRPLHLQTRDTCAVAVNISCFSHRNPISVPYVVISTN
jgi:hypothetical protein